MPGPPPKDPKLRQRTNKAVTHAKVKRRAPARKVIPELFSRPCQCGGGGKTVRRTGRKPRQVECQKCLGTGTLVWHPLTMAWWRDVWTSEVAGQYLRVDEHGLFRLAVLVERYWRESETEGLGLRSLAAEIRQQQMAFGLAPLDRLRLQWAVEQPEEQPKEEELPEADGIDPRGVLRMA